MVWEPGEEAWEAKLAVLRSYRRATGHLTPRQDAVWGDPAGTGSVPIGQQLANLRRKDGLGKDSYRAAKEAAQLTAIDADGDCPWPLDWQRHYRVLADLSDADGHLPHIAPGIIFEGDAVGTWRSRQQEHDSWAKLLPEPVPRGAVVDVLVDDETVPIKLGVWLSNTMSRRDKLPPEQLAALAGLGLEWAA
ncbi:hypothetical protein SAMN05216483_6387 [Streptomyces sp. 2131.1]|nr:hypothetical protein SAMN05216483_6387 [Streptomyces sp. 2131.1]